MRDTLGESEFAAAVEEGRFMTMEQAVASALQNDSWWELREDQAQFLCRPRLVKIQASCDLEDGLSE